MSWGPGRPTTGTLLTAAAVVHAPAHARRTAVPVASQNHQLNFFLLWQSFVSFGLLTENIDR